MMKLFIFILVIGVLYGVFSYKDGKVIIDTQKGKNLIKTTKSHIVIKNNEKNKD